LGESNEIKGMLLMAAFLKKMVLINNDLRFPSSSKIEGFWGSIFLLAFKPGFSNLLRKFENDTNL
jgi:hypothetical protein